MKTTQNFSAILLAILMVTIMSCGTTKTPLTMVGGHYVFTDTLAKSAAFNSPEKLRAIQWLAGDDITLTRVFQIQKDTIINGVYVTSVNQKDSVVIPKFWFGVIPEKENSTNIAFEADTLKIPFVKSKMLGPYAPYILGENNGEVTYGQYTWKVSKGKNAMLLFDIKESKEVKKLRLAKGLKVGVKVAPPVAQQELPKNITPPEVTPPVTTTTTVAPPASTTPFKYK